MLVQHRRSGSRLRMEIPEALLDASPAPPHGSHDDAGTGSSNPLPSSGESCANLTWGEGAGRRQRGAPVALGGLVSRCPDADLPTE